MVMEIMEEALIDQGYGNHILKVLKIKKEFRYGEDSIC